MNEHNRLTAEENRAFYRMAIALVIPMALQNLINVGVTTADVVMLGKVGETALSGASLAGQVQFIMNLIFFGLTSGASVLTAQYWGKQDVRTIEKVFGISMCISLGIGLVFLAAAQIIPRQLMYAFSSEEPVIQEGISYLRIVSWSYLPVAFTMIYLNLMRSVERVVVATWTYFDYQYYRKCHSNLRHVRDTGHGSPGCGLCYLICQAGGACDRGTVHKLEGESHFPSPSGFCTV